MATRSISRVFSLSLGCFSHKSRPLHRSTLSRIHPVAAAIDSFRRISPAATIARGFATRQTTSSLNDSSPNWSNRPPKETILLDGCDFEHWLVVVETPEENLTRDEIIASYIKTIASVVGSEDEARMKIYSVSTKHYYAFGALVSEELSYKLKELPHVRWVLPDSYLDVKNKDYGGEPFINGQAVPYDPKYHEEWVRNNARANERNRRNDRPRNNDRSRNFDRRPNNMPQRGGPPGNMGGGPPGNMGAMEQNNVGAMQRSSVGGVPNMGQVQNGNMGGPSQNMGGMAPNMRGAPQRQTENFEQRGMANNGGYSTNTPGGNSYQAQDIPERNMPHSNYQ